MSKIVHAYTDGGCIGNPGPGAWAYAIGEPGYQAEASGFEGNTTNNRMELNAVIHILKLIQQRNDGASYVIHTDSQYVQKGITQWINSWKRNGWKTASKQPVKNQDLWMQLDQLNQELQVQWAWVKGHAGNELNERCDTLVGECIRRNRT